MQPSIFDTEKIKELKQILSEMVEKLQETREQEKINAEIQEIKKKEGEEVQVDENFGKPMQNAAEFKDMTATIKIGKKRTQPDVQVASEKPASGEPEAAKRQKVDSEP